jgi:hypothetical protein
MWPNWRHYRSIRLQEPRKTPIKLTGFRSKVSTWNLPNIKCVTQSTSTFFEDQHIYGTKILKFVVENCWRYQINIACVQSVQVYLASQTLGPLWRTTGWLRELTATPVT